MIETTRKTIQDEIDAADLRHGWHITETLDDDPSPVYHVYHAAIAKMAAIERGNTDNEIDEMGLLADGAIW